MDFKIRKKRTKEEYSEYLSSSNYVKKLIKNPKKRIPSFNRKLSEYIILSVILLVVTLIEEFFIKHDRNNYMIIVPLVIVLISLIIIKIMTYMETKTFSELDDYIDCSVNDKKIVFRYKKDSIESKWDNIKYIIINKYTICFIPNVLPGNFVSIPIEYKNKIIKVLKTYNKEELLIDNSKLYE